MQNPGGFLAIWSDVLAVDETDYLHWLTREHVSERLSVPGFVSARVFRTALSSGGRFFILYRTSDAGVIDSADYVARLDNPTPWSQRIMPKLSNFARGGGAVRFSEGSGEGAAVAPILLDASEGEHAPGLAREMLRADKIVRTSVLEVDQKRTSVQTREKSMRKSDASFSGLLLAEALEEAALSEVAAQHRAQIYRQIFAQG